MSNIDDIDNIKSDRDTGDTSDIEDPLEDENSSVSSSESRDSKEEKSDSRIDSINDDEPSINRKPSRKLKDMLESIDKDIKGKHRLPLNSNRSVSSIRIIPLDSSSRSKGATSKKSSPSARSYTPVDHSRLDSLPDKKMPKSQRLYIMRQKFIRLNKEHPEIEVPDSNDPDALIACYKEAKRTIHYTSTSSSWIVYMAVGYAGIWGLAQWMGFDLSPYFVPIQIEVMSHYTSLLKQLGDPGGISMGSGWPPLVKLLVIIVIHTAIFVIIYKVTGNVEACRNAQMAMCSTGFMGGKSQGDTQSATGATSIAGGLMSALGGLFNGQGGDNNNILKNIMNIFTGNTSIDNINLDAPPEPVSERELPEQNSKYSSKRKNPFDR